MRSFTVGRVWGIPIRINASLLLFLPVLAWLIGSGAQIETYATIVEGFAPGQLDVAALRAGATPWVIGAAAAVGLFVSVLLHELGHSYVARRYGIDIESITLWIFGGVASLRSVPREWDREFWIAVAGPIVSVLTAAACYLAVRFLPLPSGVVVFVVGWLAVTNVTLAVFNMLPAFPMDGGRVLRALLARRRPYAVATRTAARIGVGFAFLFALAGVLWFSPVLFLMAFFVYGAATGESRAVALDDLLDGMTVADLMARDPPTVPAETTVGAFTDRLFAERRTGFALADGGDIAGYVSIEDLRRRKLDDDAPVSAALPDPVPRVDAAADAFEALAELSGAKGGHALVTEGDRVVGVVSQADYARAVQLRRRAPSEGRPTAF
ncbi:site-2 protease family protein [Halopelagius longus]|uniref:Zinc metalloprotease n=1 Tax=Halopelagius longus TaxID=1236180 RepID=A0A1H0YK00_9EURY|nr:site-2 protease family protein [Halopelagius longus]RDI72531.1 site-2 protease family protein [Halopelagius longus]SDQ15507.1 Zn-dependent protease (includes SpoIVFB) [Halopelagius longus]